MMGLLGSGSHQCYWEAAAGHPTGSVWTRGSLKRDAFCITVPTASSSAAWLVPASPRLHQPGLELHQPSWHRWQHQKVDAPGEAPGTRQLRHGWCANMSLLTWQRPHGPGSQVPKPSSIPLSAPALLAEDLLAAGVKFPTGTCSPMDGGSSHDLTGVSHPALLAHTFGLLLSPMGARQQKNM